MFLFLATNTRAALLTREACRCVSRVCALLFQPALVISSTGGTLNFADLQDSWQLVVAGGLTVGLSVAVAWVSARLLLGPESRRAFRPVELAIAFQNCAFIPLLLMESLCEQDSIKRCVCERDGRRFTVLPLLVQHVR